MTSIGDRRGVSSIATQTYVPRWEAARLERVTVSGFNHKREAEQRHTAFYCANVSCGCLMDDGDIGVICAECRAAVVLRP